MSSASARNIRDQICPECQTGKAELRFRPPKTYFWGCSFFPDCYGPKAWQSIQVPEEQRQECDEKYKKYQVDKEQDVPKKEKKRETRTKASK